MDGMNVVDRTNGAAVGNPSNVLVAGGNYNYAEFMTRDVALDAMPFETYVMVNGERHELHEYPGLIVHSIPNMLTSRAYNSGFGKTTKLSYGRWFVLHLC